MEQEKTTAGQGLGIAGLVLGILAIPLGIIPCTFIPGLLLGVTGIVFGAVGYTQAKKANGPVGLTIGALAVSIVGTCFALIWALAVVSTTNLNWLNFQNNIHKFDKTVKHSEELEKAFESFGEEMEDVLKELEEGDSVHEKIEIDIDESLKGLSDEEKARKIGKAAGKALHEFVKEVKDTSSTDK
ncbi:MAG: DMT family transporter [Bacteroidales bacterium]|nr:DMT family transporter [Bacteroidales bacterium]